MCFSVCVLFVVLIEVTKILFLPTTLCCILTSDPAKLSNEKCTCVGGGCIPSK